VPDVLDADDEIDERELHAAVAPALTRESRASIERWARRRFLIRGAVVAIDAPSASSRRFRVLAREIADAHAIDGAPG